MSAGNCRFVSSHAPVIFKSCFFCLCRAPRYFHLCCVGRCVFVCITRVVLSLLGSLSPPIPVPRPQLTATASSDTTCGLSFYSGSPFHTRRRGMAMVAYEYLRSGWWIPDRVGFNYCMFPVCVCVRERERACAT